MANFAYYELRVYGNKEGVERFHNIIKGDDKKYVFSAFDQSEMYGHTYSIGDGNFYRDFFGEVKWGTSHLFDKSNDMIVCDTGIKNITWLTASELLGLTMECYCEECGSSFNEYFSVSKGKNLCSNTIYWSNPGVFNEPGHQKNIDDFENEVAVALKKGIPLDMSQVNTIRVNEYRALEELDCFSFGGYDWIKHSENEIINIVEPVVNSDIRRL